VFFASSEARLSESDRVMNKAHRSGIAIDLFGATRASATMIGKCATHDKAAHYEPGH